MRLLLLFLCKRHLRGAKEAPRTQGNCLGVRREECEGKENRRLLAENGQKQIRAIITITTMATTVTTTTSAAAKTS